MTLTVLPGLNWIVAALSVGAGVLAILLSASSISRQRSSGTRLALLMGGEHAGRNILHLLIGWLEGAGRKLSGETPTTRQIRHELAKAGYFSPAAPYVFLALRLLISLAAFVSILIWRGGQGIDLLLALIFGYLTYRCSLILVKVVGERRARRIQRELPSVLDLILMVLDSGVSIDQCLHYVASVTARSAPTTSAVLVKHIADVDSGLPYDAALDRLGQRLAVDEGVDFASLLKQATFHGGELGPSLRRYSTELAERRLSRAREEGGRRATYLTMVMVFFFVPVLLVVLLGPAVVDVGDTLRSVAVKAHKVQPK
ncbi:MAG: type II secretion system F family protein [Parvibaculum sp.]|uniref:type II secretion system F family protein n=1 Tax=Parvibaculum sp. TaxID=2024848 RepID=UPI003C760BF9